jgi:transposase
MKGKMIHTPLFFHSVELNTVSASSGGEDKSLHNYWGIVDGEGKRVFKKKLANDPEQNLEMLGRFGGDWVGVGVESPFNWYWLVDLLR